MAAKAAGSNNTASGSAAAVAAAASSSLPWGGVAIWDMDQTQVEVFLRSTHILHPLKADADPKPQVALRLMQNLFGSIAPLLASSSTKRSTTTTTSTTTEPPLKRLKVTADDSSQQDSQKKPSDPYHIWIAHPNDSEQQQQEEIPNTVGAILVQLTTAGWINALAGRSGGLVDRKIQPIDKLQQPLAPTTVLETACHCTYQQLRTLAVRLQRATATHMERDFLLTTPHRIYQMMCAHEVTPAEFKAIRRRVYDTVVLGKGVSSSNNNNNNNVLEEDDDVVVASRNSSNNNNKGGEVMDMYQKCPTCGNKDPSLFVLDRRNGDVICSNCGTVAMESIMHEGSQYRKFEGEADRNHHGDAANPLYSNAHNLSTTLGGVQVTSSAGGGGWGSQNSKQGMEVVLRNAHAYTEMNCSQFGKGEKRTRIGYKDRQKREAFVMMVHVGDALTLHEAVVQRAKELFAGFRDDRELVQQFRGVVAACLCEAFDQLSRDGRQILKQRELQIDDGEVLLNARASRRNELHHANLAGKGGLLLDMEAVEGGNGNGKNGVAAEASVASAFETKPTSSWDLDDCRSWLLEASRKIAQEWLEERKKPNANNKDRIPKGTREELEGKLVEHTLTLCDQLEAELKSRDQKRTTTHHQRVNTPRVQEMGRLSIKWQHEGKAAASNGRTAGQILFLKTAKKLGSVLKDPVAGEAFHKELRALVGRQDARKRKEMRDEASRQRLQQMKRKPWLQARAQASS